MKEGKKVKCTTTYRIHTIVERIPKCVLERRQWEKFGAGLKSDNSNVTYASNEDVTVEDPQASVVVPGEKKEEESVFSGIKNSSIVNCRHCGMVGDHWTLKCPYKDTPNETMDKATVAAHVPVSNPTGKYIPPSQRTGTEISSTFEDRDHATLRVTNISSETRDTDLHDLFSPFGQISRIYLAKDRETLQSRGFAFVSFYYREDAERALQALQGYGYDHLILKLEWAKPSTKEKTVSDEPNMSTTFRSGYGKALPQNMAPSKK